MSTALGILACLARASLVDCRQVQSIQSPGSGNEATGHGDDLSNLAALLATTSQASAFSAPVGASTSPTVASVANSMQRSRSRSGADVSMQFPRNFQSFFKFQEQVPDDFENVQIWNNCKEQLFGDWPESDEKMMASMRNLYIVLMVFVSGPIAYQTYDTFPTELPLAILTANIGTFFGMFPFIFFLRQRFGYVRQILREDETYYEEGGLTLIADKTRAQKTRDKLIILNEVNPRIRRLDARFRENIKYFGLSVVVAELVAIFGPKVYVVKTLYGGEALDYRQRLKSDRRFAMQEQAKIMERTKYGRNPRPLYCEDRYSGIMAGAGVDANCK